MTRENRVTALCIVSIIAAVLVFFWYIVLGQTTMLFGNNLDVYYPQWGYYRLMLEQGGIPLWNPYTYSGTPYHADVQTVLFYPLSLVSYFLPVLESLGWSAILHFMIAGIGMYLYLREHVLRHSSALFGAFAFTFGGFLVTYIQVIIITNSAAWLPWVMLGSEMAWRRRDMRWILLGGAAFALCFLAGHTQVYYYIGVLLGLEALWRTASSKRKLILTNGLRSGCIALGIILLSVSLSAIQFLPTIEIAKYSTRVAGLDISESHEGHWTWSHLFTLVVPTALGLDTRAVNAGIPHFTELTGYVGILALVFGAFALFHSDERRKMTFFLCISLIAIGVAMGSLLPFHQFLYDYFPYFSTFRVHTRTTLLLLFSVSVLGAFGFEVFQKKTFTARSLVPVWIMIGCIGVSLVYLTFKTMEIPLDRLSLLRSTAIASFTLVAISGILILRHHRVMRRFLVPGILSLLLLELFGNTIGYNHRINPYLLPLPTREEFHEMGKFGGMTRLLSYSASANYSMLNRAENVGGYSILYLRDYYDIVQPLIQLQRLDSPLLDFLNVGFMKLSTETSPDEIQTFKNSGVLPRAVIVHSYLPETSYEEDKAFIQSYAFRPDEHVILSELSNPSSNPLNEDDDEKEKVKMTAYSEDEIHWDVQLTEPGVLSTSEVYYPGWEAIVDGHPEKILRSNLAFRSVALSAGHHEITMRYRPLSFRIGRMISIVSLLSMIGFLVWQKIIDQQ